MLPTEDLFAHVYVLIDELVTARIIAIPRRPGPHRPAATPSCSPSRRSGIRRTEAGFLAEVARD